MPATQSALQEERSLPPGAKVAVLGTSSESVDIVELNREEQKIGDKKPR